MQRLTLCMHTSAVGSRQGLLPGAHVSCRRACGLCRQYAQPADILCTQTSTGQWQGHVPMALCVLQA